MGLLTKTTMKYKFKKLEHTQMLFIVLCKHLKCKIWLCKLDKARGLTAMSLGAAGPVGWQTICPCR